jgi:hypothetical protein
VIKLHEELHLCHAIGHTSSLDSGDEQTSRLLKDHLPLLQLLLPLRDPHAALPQLAERLLARLLCHRKGYVLCENLNPPPHYFFAKHILQISTGVITDIT